MHGGHRLAAAEADILQFRRALRMLLLQLVEAGFRAGIEIATAETLGQRQPDEFDALFLGILHFAHRARHVGLVAAIQALHRRGALADRRAYAVHRHIAAADDDYALVLRVQAAVFVFGTGIPHPLSV